MIRGMALSKVNKGTNLEVDSTSTSRFSLRLKGGALRAVAVAVMAKAEVEFEDMKKRVVFRNQTTP